MQDGVGIRLVVAPLQRVVPREIEDRAVTRIRRIGQLLPDPLAEVIDPVQLGAGISGRLDRLVMPLQQPLGVRERPVLLGVRGGRKEEHLGVDVLGPRLLRLVLGRVLPEQRGLVGIEVADDEPIELAKRPADEARVG